MFSSDTSPVYRNGCPSPKVISLSIMERRVEGSSVWAQDDLDGVLDVLQFHKSGLK